MKRHPICDELNIPEPTEARIKELAEDMRENGWDRRYPSWMFQKRVLVGNTREAAAKIAGVKPLRKTFKGTREQAVAFCFRSEVSRRHLSPEQEAKAKASRQVRVAELRESGKSQRQIADELNVTKTTVARDLEQLASVAPADGQVKGSDGKARAAQVADNRCAPCKRKFPTSRVSVKDCQACKRERVEAKARKTGRDAGSHEPRRKPVPGGRPVYDWRPFHDGFGQVMRQIDIFGRIYGVKDSGEADRLRQELAAFKKHFDTWTVNVSRTPAKEA